MADVYVNNWTEFVSAVAVSGDTVYLPEEAEWDMEEILPWGTQSAITMACTEINGRGTTIKNLHLNQPIVYTKNNIRIRNLIMKDWLCEGGSQDAEKAVFTCNANYNIYFYSCEFSGILSSIKERFVYGFPHNYNCSFNIEASGNWFEFSRTGGSTNRYCRMEMHLPNNTYVGLFGLDCEFCELIAYSPNATGMFYSLYYKGCTFRGNLQGITKDNGSSTWTGFVSVYLDGTFGEGFSAKAKNGFVKCTEAQMKDPEFLRGKGFPIVVIEDGDT